eukprot:6123577-Prymnesium_polylepis.1
MWGGTAAALALALQPASDASSWQSVSSPLSPPPLPPSLLQASTTSRGGHVAARPVAALLFVSALLPRRRQAAVDGHPADGPGRRVP